MSGAGDTAASDARHGTESGQAESEADTRGGGVGGMLVVHLFVALQVGLIFGPFEAILYAFMPFMLLGVALNLMGAAPLFALLCVAPSLAALAGGAPLLRLANARLAPRLRRLAWIALAMWLPLVCGEGLRALLMRPVLASTPAACQGQVDLFVSIQRKLPSAPSRRPHAWVIRNGQPWLWSYRSLRFEPAPDWVGAQLFSDACPLFDEPGSAS